MMSSQELQTNHSLTKVHYKPYLLKNSLKPILMSISSKIKEDASLVLNA
jgi:hypothetical protein